MKPSVEAAVYRFEAIFDLRRATTGEFVARSSDPSRPPLVTEIGDDLGYEVKRWWRKTAEEWNQALQERKEEKREKEQQEREERYRLEDEARIREEQEQAAQIEAAFEGQEAVQEETAPPVADGEEIPPFIEIADEEDEDEDDKKAEVFPAPSRFATILDHLRASADQHDRVALLTRVMDEPGRLVVDLCDDAGRVVAINSGGFSVCDPRDVPGAWFRRGGDMGAQVIPVRPRSVLEALEKARKVIGMTPEQWKVALGGLLGGHFPSIDRPGTWLTGPSGAGKTTRGRMLAGWIDPAKYLGGRLNIKRDERDARTRAMHRYVLTMDNVSRISPG